MVTLPFLRMAAFAASIQSTVVGFSGVSRYGSIRSSSQSSFLSSAMGVSRLSFYCQPTVLQRGCSVRQFMSSRSPPPSSSSTKGLQMPQTKRPKLPIILLSGFLGSGKTTTLQHLLENTEGVKIAVIVNDVASVNIDAKLVAATQSNGVMELRNGCACCSLADELLDSVSSLLGSDRTFDALVVEMSGVGDPIAIRSNWNAAKARGHPVTAKADVSQVVTLIDASTFGTDWMTWDLAAEREGWVERGDDCAGERKVPELLAEQVEAADLILINKVDIAGDNVAVATSLARELNDKAIIKQVQYGKVSPSLIIQGLQPETESKKNNVKTPPRVSRVQKTSTNDLGITSFVYKANRPFNMRKLMAELNTWPVPMKDILDLDLLKEAQEGGYKIEGQTTKEPSPFTGVLRSKGFCWFAPTKWAGQNADAYRHDTAMYWSHAGKHFGISAAGKWWGSVSSEMMAEFFKGNMKEYERIIREDFVSEEYGDRRQEIVFIGVGLKQDEITTTLDNCLVGSVQGMERYRQELENYKNTFFSSSARGPGLFDVGVVDHMDME